VTGSVNHPACLFRVAEDVEIHAVSSTNMTLIQHMETARLYRKVLGAVLEKVPNSRQGIHLHCFNGDLATVKL